MPQPQPYPHHAAVHRAALITLLAGAAIMALKFLVFGLTNSVAVLSDALESIINLLAAAAMLYSARLSAKPADDDHPYGHGKVEFLTVGLEGWLILAAGAAIAAVAVKRLIVPVQPHRLDLGTGLLAAVNILNGALAAYVYIRGRKLKSQLLLADGKHLITDFLSTLGVLAGLILVNRTGYPRLDPLVALLMAALILAVSWRLLWQSIDGLMDKRDPADHALICRLLDEEIQSGAIRGYHKVRHRHVGSFHWIDLHLQVDPNLTVRQSHDLASRIEHRIEQALGPADATAHVEPHEPTPSAAPRPPAA